MGLISLEPMPSSLSLWNLFPDKSTTSSMDFKCTNSQEAEDFVLNIDSAVERIVALRMFADCSVVVQARVLQTAAGHFYELAETIRPAKFGSISRIFQLVYDEENKCYLRSEREIAVKIHDKVAMDRNADSEEDPLEEIRALQKLANQHRNLIHVMDVFEDTDNIYVVMPLYNGGDLLDMLDQRVDCGLPMHLEATEARHVFTQIVSGLKEMHDHGIAHRDLSLENVLYDDVSETFVIIDLGACIQLPRDAQTKGHLPVVPRRGIFGKLNYIAPEMWLGGEFFEPMKTDIWALGIMLFMLLTASTPVNKASASDPYFTEIAEGHVIPMAMKRIYGEDEHCVDTNVLLAMDLLHRMLRPNPSERLSIEEVLAHPWISSRK